MIEKFAELAHDLAQIALVLYQLLKMHEVGRMLVNERQHELPFHFGVGLLHNWKLPQEIVIRSRAHS